MSQSELLVYIIHTSTGGLTMLDHDRPPIAFTCIGGLFALLMILGQMQLTAHGVKLASIIDIADPSAYTQIAMAE